jgi:murein DD-endopeptidase MepM/ murein hydrolase activator NlpD
MPNDLTMRRILLRAGIATALGLGAVLLVAMGNPTPAVAQEAEPYPMVFPIAGPYTPFSDTFGAPRSGRAHQGNDIMSPKMTPVVAVADGTVGWMHAEQGGNCCDLAINHDDGWASWYIHLNNDTPGTDDGLGFGIADGIESGVHVTVGQLIGWVGDSGNAESAGSHLHFELHGPDGAALSPWASLQGATQLGAPLPEDPPEPPCPDGEVCDSVALVDGGAKFFVYGQVGVGASVSSFFYGAPGDVPLMGDWDCDGVKTPAMYRPSNGFMYLRNSNTQGVGEVSYFYGDPSDVPLAGDFNGNGCDTLAIYRPAEGKVYVKNSLGTGIADYSFFFGNPGDKPFVGDFDGDGFDTVGLHRESSGFVYFRNSNTQGVADFSFFYGDPGDKILAGDWDGDGDDTVAVYRTSNGMLYLKNANSQGVADFSMYAGTYIAALTG